MTRIVCAAIMITSNDHAGLVIAGARHFDTSMHKIIGAIPGLTDELTSGRNCPEQGFITQTGIFVSRREAWIIAERAGQIIRRCGGDTADGGTLYSENLY